MAPILTVTLNAAVDTTLTLPTLEPGVSYTARDVLKLPGGKGLNVARTLRRLGLETHATGLAGGPAGAFITASLADEGIVPHFLEIAGTSRTCTAIVELNRRRVTEVNEPGPSITPREADGFLELFNELIGEAPLAALCGSLPPGLPGNYYATLIEQARASGVPGVLDSSGEALAQGIAARPLLVKPNAAETGGLLGTQIRTVEDAVRAGVVLRGRGARLVAITLGARGAVLSTEMGAWFARAEVAEPVNTVGSGDAFLGGFIGALCSAVNAGDGASIEAAATSPVVLVHALTLATACAAANTLVLGAGVFGPADVERFSARISVRAVA